MIKTDKQGTRSFFLAVIGLAALLTFAALVVLGGGDGRNAGAQTGILETGDPDPNGADTIYQVAVDTNTTGNSAVPSGIASNQLQGTINPCIDGAPVDTVGDLFDVDFIVDEINPANDTSGGQFDLTYDGTKLQINAYVIPSGAIDFTVIGGTTDPPLPDNSGAATPSWGKFGATPDGEIVFFRITFEVLALGNSNLDVANAIMVPGSGIGTIPVQNEFDGQVFAGSTCPAPSTPTPSPTPAPSAIFNVSKDFSDDNSINVTVALNCTSGSVGNVDTSASEADPANFTVTGFTAGATCTATETVPAGYTASQAACATVAISDGGTASCTITNTLNTATITVSKDFSDDNASAVTMGVSCSSGTQQGGADTQASDPAGVAGDAVFTINGFTPGATCTVSESTTTGYSMNAGTSTCDEGVTLQPGGTPSCTFVNEPSSTTFTITKDFTDDNAMTVNITVSCTGPSTLIDASPSPMLTTFAEGTPRVVTVTAFSGGDTCTVTETNLPTGYDASGCQAVPLAQGTTSCTVINSVEAFFDVSKDFTDDRALSVTIHLACTSGTIVANDLAATEANDANFEIRDFQIGATCTVTEPNPPSGYLVSYSGDCETETIAAGETDTCTVINTPRTAQFTVAKDFDDNSAITVNIQISCTGANTLIDGAPSPLSTTVSEASPRVVTVTAFSPSDDCTATETVPTGYHQTQACGVVPIGSTSVAGVGPACTIINVLNVATLDVAKDFTDDATTEVEIHITCTSGTVTEDDTLAQDPDAVPGNNASFTISGFTNPATCDANEVAPAGYTPVEADCDDVPIAHGASPECEIVNLDVVQFQVHKEVQGSQAQISVVVTLTCSSGQVTVIDPTANPSDPADFEINAFGLGATCTATESVPPGWVADQSDCLNVPINEAECTLLNTFQVNTPGPSITTTPTPTGTPIQTTPTTSATATATPTFTASPTPAGQTVTWGNNNCSSGDPDPVDSLITLRYDAGLNADTNECPEMGETVDVLNASLHLWGDVDCNDDVNPVDSLKLLRFDAGLGVSQEAGCPPIGSEVQIIEQ